MLTNEQRNDKPDCKPIKLLSTGAASRKLEKQEQ